MDNEALAELRGEYRHWAYETFFNADYETALKIAGEYVAALEAENIRLRAELARYQEPM